MAANKLAIQNHFDALKAHFQCDCTQTRDLEEIASLFVNYSRNTNPAYPSAQVTPWAEIYEVFSVSLSSGTTLDIAWSDAIDPFPAHIQRSLKELRDVLIEKQDKAKKELERIPTSGEYFNLFAKFGYFFRLDERDDSVWVNSQRMSDLTLSEVYRKLVDCKIMKITQAETRHCINFSASNHKFHPVREYLDNLGWDGTKRIEDLASYFQDTDSIFSLYLRKWLIGAIAKAKAEDDGAQAPMLVLDGAQGIGKSYFSRWISPHNSFHCESPITPDNKDCRLMAVRFWIWEVMELDATTKKADVEGLKGFLSMQTVNERVPYAEFPIHKPTLANYIGTINSTGGGFLSDPTGSRRFNIAHIETIDFDYTKLDKNQIWAEALCAYLDGEPWHLAAQEINLRNTINQRYETEDPIENALIANFDIDPNNKLWFCTSNNILTILQNCNIRMSSSNALSKTIAQAMKKLGCESGSSRQGGKKERGYFGIK